MKVLVGCEESGVVRRAFREIGHDAWSCDIFPSEDNSPFHIQDDVLKIINDDWDMCLFFPPCTHLAVSGARWFKEKRKDGRQQEGIDFFMQFANAKCKRIAIENPIGIMSTIWRKPDQIIQPFEYGHPERKATCLWLKGLPQLKPTNIVDGRNQSIWKMPPSKDRAKIRSKTFPGIAAAMANQWGQLSLLEVK